MSEPRCRIYREWYEMLEPLRKRDEKKWWVFNKAVLEYVYYLNEPDFSDDTELQDLWNRTSVRPYDSGKDKPGWIKVQKKRRIIHGK